MATIIKIAVLNSTTVVPASDVQDWVAAVKIQMNRDYFRSAVKSGVVSMTYYAKGAVPPLDAWWIAVIDDADMAWALGYHDITPAGLPLGKVFVKTALTYGEKPSVTLSHELLEMLGDAEVNVLVADAINPNKFWAREVCDSVEAFEYTITLPATLTKPARDIAVSDYVLQSYWNTVGTTGPWSFKNNLTGPVPTLAKGGYMAFTENGTWSQVTKFASTAPKPSEVPTKAQAMEAIRMRLDGPLDTRRIKRILPKVQWLRSTAKKVG